ncbi:MAG: hypothetical protein OEZ34_05710 [Spirochaetia bacterium]|nr:hypothetical protein [Spirochaetia bacterium]
MKPKNQTFRHNLLTILALGLVPASLYSLDQPWRERIMDDGTTTVRWTIGETEHSFKPEKSRLMKLTAETVHRGSLNDVLAVFTNVEQHNQLVMDRRTKFLKKISENEWKVYYHNQFPWPLTDQEIVAIMKIEKFPSEKKARVEITALTEPDYSEVKEAVKNKDYSAVFEIQETGESELKIKLVSNCLPPVRAPEWILNRTYHTIPHRIVSKLKKFSTKTDP